ncbi:MAG: hypothetical protein Q9216_000544 [Gyalolechia sp. 2 TL-2023]
MIIVPKLLAFAPGRVTTGPDRLPREKKWRKNHFELQTAIHETESININRPIDPNTKERIRPAKEFEHHVHNEGPSEISKSGFKRFLCSGLAQSSQFRNGLVQKLGSYHQCYRLDGRLVAMGVLDLLPGCVSSVYLIYHHDVQDWSFGKLSALREIALTVEGRYDYYYMGFYIHSCTKMRYKNQYQPSFLLDPETYSWNLLDADHLARLSARKYVSLSLERQLHLPPRRLTDSDKLGLDSDALLRLREYQREVGPGGKSQSSALGSCMPGLMSLEEVENVIDIGKWPLKYGNFMHGYLEHLGDWAIWNIHDPSSLKGAVAELAAALGPSLVSQLVLDLG